MLRHLAHIAATANPATDCLVTFQLTGSLVSALTALAGSTLLRAVRNLRLHVEKGVSK